MVIILYIIVFPLTPSEVCPPPYISDGMELLYHSCATTSDTFYLMVGFPSVFQCVLTTLQYTLNTLARVVRNHVYLLVENDLGLITLASVIRNYVFQ